MDIEANKKELIEWIENLDDETLLAGLLSIKQSHMQGDWENSISDPNIERAWVKEATQRLKEVEDGDVEPIPGEQVMDELNKITEEC